MEQPPFMFWIGVAVGEAICVFWMMVLSWLSRRKDTEPEREAEFFEPVQYPTMEQVEARRMAREYSKQTTEEY